MSSARTANKINAGGSKKADKIPQRIANIRYVTVIMGLVMGAMPGARYP